MKRTLRDQYAQKSANTMANVKPYKTSSGYGWRFACPQCGLTENGFKKQKRCASLYYSEYSKKWFAKCYRCKVFDYDLTGFIKYVSPRWFKEYQMQRFENGTTGKGFDVPHPDFIPAMQKNKERLQKLIDKKPNTVTKWIT